MSDKYAYNPANIKPVPPTPPHPPGWWGPCLEHLGSVTVCAVTHCLTIQDYDFYHKWCVDKAMYAPIHTSQCICKDNNGHLTKYYQWDPTLKYKGMQISYQHQCLGLIFKFGSDSGWDFDECSCCCTCLAYDTPIAIPDGVKAIQDVKIGDVVLAAAPEKGHDSLTFKWSHTKVAFSDGVAHSLVGTPVIVVYYGEQSMIVTVDQLFMMPNGKLKRADRLVPGTDSLVGANGEAIPLLKVAMGEYKGGIHHIATTMDFDGSIDNHLLNANGVIIGDYLLQLHQNELKEDAEVVMHSQLPIFGTQEYVETNPHLSATLFAASPPEAKDIATPALTGQLALFSGETSNIPDSAMAFFTEAQMHNIRTKGEYFGFSDPAHKYDVERFFKLYGAFYPEVTFYLDWGKTRPNCWAFEEYGHKIIVYSGALVRLKTLSKEGHAIILANAIGRFYGGKPVDSAGNVCQGQADYYGVGVAMRDVFADDYIQITNKGTDQISNLFDYCENGEEHEEQRDKCQNPLPDCRILAMQNAIFGDLPPCAGGPTPEGLKLLGAEPEPDKVTVRFNMILDQESAEDPSHYAITPNVEIKEAVLDQTDLHCVILTADIKAETAYTLTVSHVFAEDQSDLDPDHSSKTFMLPE